MKKKYIDHYGIDSLPHLIEASRAGCDAFITINDPMLKDRKELEKKFKIKIRTPKEILEEENGKEKKSKGT